MTIVSYWENEVPTISKDEEAHHKKPAQKPDIEIDSSDITKTTDFLKFMTLKEAEVY